jgi:hypothetical protein
MKDEWGVEQSVGSRRNGNFLLGFNDSSYRWYRRLISQVDIAGWIHFIGSLKTFSDLFFGSSKTQKKVLLIIIH